MHREARGAVRFLLVYVREAHALEEWVSEDNVRPGVAVSQPTSVDGRRDAARTMCGRLDVSMPAVADTIDDRVATLYGAWPDRIYVLDESGVVVHKTAVGPFGFHTTDVRDLLVARWGLTLSPATYVPPKM
jgi:hypothetical protein